MYLSKAFDENSRGVSERTPDLVDKVLIQRHLVVPRVHVLAKKVLVQLESTMISSNLAL